jgi:hypothetical protein
MNKYLTSFLVILFLLSASYIRSQTINARFSTYFYTWQRLDSVAASGSETYTNHLKGYQNLLFDVSSKKWSFNTFLQTDEDVVNKIGRGFGYRFYNLYVKGTNLFDVMDLKLGRSFITAGVYKSSTDGLYMKLKLGKNKEYQVIAYGGELTPLSYEIDKYPNIKDNYSVGGQFLYYGVKDLMLGLSYSNKHRKPESYYALRADSLFNTREVLVETDSPADQLAGLDINYTFKQKHNFYGKAYFDINVRKLYRGEFNTSVQANDNIRISASYLYREPQISYNTIFWVFTHKQNQEIEGGIDYLFNNGINVYGRLGNVFYDGDNSLKLQLGVSSSFYGISFVKYTGYAGESDGFNGYLSHELIKSKLVLSSNLNYSRYKIGNYSSDRLNAFAGSLGFTYRPEPRISVDAQGQFITNEIYKFDTRFLVGFNYWLFSKF